MNEENNKIIFDILQAALFQKDIQLPTSIEWKSIFQEMKMQTVAGIPYEWLSSNALFEPDIQKQWTKYVIFQVSFWVKLLHEQQQLIELMEKNRINMAILKGCAASIYYPKPEYRTMGDVDFLVPPQDFQRAYHILLENGYVLAYPENHVSYHITFKKNNVIFEIHNKPAGLPNNKFGNYLQKLIEKGLQSIQYPTIENYSIPVLPRLQNGLVLLLHIVKHLEGGLGLRQIVDWMMFVSKELNDIVWKSEFQPVLQKTGLEQLAMTVTRMCQLYLGLRTENITWCSSVDPTLCKQLLTYFMEKGNFGRKQPNKGTGIHILSTTGNIVVFFQTLQSRGLSNWKSAQKYSFLRPFAWGYQICRYIRLGFSRKHPFQSLKEDYTKSQNQIRLFEKLKLFQ